MSIWHHIWHLLGPMSVMQQDSMILQKTGREKVNVEGLIRRCGGGFINPFGDSNQYDPTPSASSTSLSTSKVVPGTGITTNTAVPRTSTAALPFVSPSEIPLGVMSESISGGAIAGTVIGILAAASLVGLLALCWCKKHAVSHGPTRTTMTKMTEPVVVKIFPANQTHHYASASVPDGIAPSYVANNGGYNGQQRC
ncbi:hypothetical protein BG011_004514 [Mortierella polycephala]|uniref:Uncharacterized protein n=1 Tax=Mortierella polycephala TaxID=41804 RepID=A0A9P6QIN6_9FUNG|nr:hypothetical protein BG011_004514 [Mortierella polycephala]